MRKFNSAVAARVFLLAALLPGVTLSQETQKQLAIAALRTNGLICNELDQVVGVLDRTIHRTHDLLK